MVLVDGGGGDKVEGGEAAVQLGVVLQAAVRGTAKQEKKKVFLFFLSSRVLSLLPAPSHMAPFGGGRDPQRFFATWRRGFWFPSFPSGGLDYGLQTSLSRFDFPISYSFFFLGGGEMICLIFSPEG